MEKEMFDQEIGTVRELREEIQSLRAKLALILHRATYIQAGLRQEKKIGFIEESCLCDIIEFAKAGGQ